ncbi:hypothetical protein [Stutzerimonas stutzeri]|uniref:hypothetical protein n=1 Tax=Stutzerimonas stutzeri TaxID=316 RepID=UPI0015E444C0|nr:hypothetical protein [Stutzerimonas stutzeri]MBA1280280.1 hypothetical protein [Stutzerimonas stutzeri]
MDQIVIENLLKMGFTPTTYEGQDGVFYTKKIKASDVPYLAEKVVDDDVLFGDDLVTYCVCPDGEVQLVYGDQYEKGHMFSPEGQALLLDIGYPTYHLSVDGGTCQLA